MYISATIAVVIAVAVATVAAENGANDLNMIFVEQDLDVAELFPAEFGLRFRYNGQQIDTSLTRDDTVTSQLSSFIFDTSRTLPNGAFSKEKSGEYSSYGSGIANVTMQRADLTVPSKLYGHIFLDNKKYSLIPEDSNMYRLTQIVEKTLLQDADTRQKREALEYKQLELTDRTHVIELFLYTDYSIYDFWASSVSTSQEPHVIKAGINDWLNSLSRDVDTLFKRVKEYSSVDVRVYVQGLFISSDPGEIPWSNDAVDEDKLDDIADYYQTMVDNFAFPNSDHVMVLTRNGIASGEQFIANNKVCGAGKQRAISYVNTVYSVKSIAQAIASSMGVRLDGSTGTPCDGSDGYVMSPDYTSSVSATNRENPWKLSLCSVLYIQEFIESGKGSCLLTTDTSVDFKTFMMKHPIGHRYSPKEQCTITFGKASSFCTLKDSKEMSECFNQREGCMVDGVCVPHQMGDLTLCGEDSSCRYGSCRSKREVGHGTVANKNFLTSTAFYSSSSIGSSIQPSATTTTTQGNFQSSTTTTEAQTTTTEAQTTTTAQQTTTVAQTTTAQPTTTTVAQTTTAQPTTTTVAQTTTAQPTTTTVSQTTTAQPTTTTVAQTTTAQLTTTEPNLQSSSTTIEAPSTTTGTPSCVVDFGFEDVTLPGCGCCGGCGCDTSCDSCPNGFGRPATSLNPETCNITDNCCPGKIRIYTSFIPNDCDVEVTPNNQTLVIVKRGWEVTNLDVNAVARPRRGGGWTVAFE